MEKYYKKFRRNRYLNLFIVNLRFLIGFGFLPSGIKKIFDIPFAVLGNEGPFFDFLDALYYTEFYYNFIGWVQVIAAVLLITQRYATLGAVIFFPVILNIMFLTLSTIGSFTPVIATLMFLGILFLLIWDYYKWVNIFSPDNELLVNLDYSDSPGYSKIWIFSGILILLMGVLLSLIIEHHKLLDPNQVPKFLSILILITFFIPVLTFIIDELKFRRKRSLASSKFS